MIKSTKTLKSIAVLLIIPASIFLINFIFFSGNTGAEKYVDAYISDSKAIELDMENDMGDSDFESNTIYTGLKTAFLRGKLTKTHMSKRIFYNTKYEKYFSISIIPEKSLQTIVYDKFVDRTIIAQVSNYEMANSSYGTRDNPIHIFMLEIPGVKNPTFLEKVITKDQYRRTVSFYLTYMMPKKEFKKLFKNGVSINNKIKSYE